MCTDTRSVNLADTVNSDAGDDDDDEALFYGTLFVEPCPVVETPTIVVSNEDTSLPIRTEAHEDIASLVSSDSSTDIDVPLGPFTMLASHLILAGHLKRKHLDYMKSWLETDLVSEWNVFDHLLHQTLNPGEPILDTNTLKNSLPHPREFMVLMIKLALEESPESLLKVATCTRHLLPNTGDHTDF